MNLPKIIVLFVSLFLWSIHSYGQDTIRLQKKPKVILHSWYPEYKPNPKLKIGEGKILFTVVDGLVKTVLWNNDFDLKSSNSQVHIEETIKSNQYAVKLGPTNAKHVEIEAWFDLGDKVVLVKQNGKWININKLYVVKDKRILMGTIKLEVMK